ERSEINLCLFFFFQAEDGIRDFHVTGVQTCALPICRRAAQTVLSHVHAALDVARNGERRQRRHRSAADQQSHRAGGEAQQVAEQIGRASCRERVEVTVGGE